MTLGDFIHHLDKYVEDSETRRKYKVVGIMVEPSVILCEEKFGATNILGINGYRAKNLKICANKYQ